MTWPILSTVTYLPLVGAAIIFFFIRGDSEAHRRNILNVSLGVTLLTFLVSLLIWWNFDPANPGFQFVEEAAWSGGFMSYRMGVDGISMLFVILTTFLMPFCILASWRSVQSRLKEYMVAFLVLESLMIGVFCALDMILFYVFFEGRPDPDVPHHRHLGRAAPGLRGLQVLPLHAARLGADAARHDGDVWEGGTDLIPGAARAAIPRIDADLALAGLLRLLRGEDADVAGAHLAARCARRGADCRIGGARRHPAQDGRLRLPALLAARCSRSPAPTSRRSSIRSRSWRSSTPRWSPMQEDMKKLIAYSSVAHMGFVTMGIFTMTAQGVQGGIFQMLSHGIVSGALFLCVGIIYDRMHTRQIEAYGGLVNRMPWYALTFMVFTMAMSGCRGRPASSASS
jgi:NADH-quinone oxidoreductase subunit M